MQTLTIDITNVEFYSVAFLVAFTNGTMLQTQNRQINIESWLPKLFFLFPLLTNGTKCICAVMCKKSCYSSV